ncbi:hypothetical protein Tco_0779126 [Tanacetum coccineum]
MYLAMALRSVKNKGKKVYNRIVAVAVGGSWEGKGKVPTKLKMIEYSSKGTPSSNLSLCCVYESETKKEKADAKNEKKHEKAVKRAGVEAATAKLRAKKTVVVAEKAKTDMEKKLVVLRSLERAEGDISSTDGSGSSGSDDAHGAADAGSGLNRLAAAAAARDVAAMSRAEDGATLQLAAAAAARDVAAMSRAEDGATLQLNDDDGEEEGRPTYEHVSSDDDT